MSFTCNLITVEATPGKEPGKVEDAKQRADKTIYRGRNFAKRIRKGRVSGDVKISPAL